MITFGDLEILAKLNISPNSFKKLIITGWDATHRKILYFNAENTLNMPIVYAGRISMSILTVFESPCLDLTRFGGRYAQPTEGLLGRTKLFDGGLASNVHTEFFVNGEEGSIKKQLQQHSTLTCIFDAKEKGRRATSKMQGFQQGKDTLGSVLEDTAIELVSMASGTNTNVAQNHAVESRKLDDTGNIMVARSRTSGNLKF